MAKAPNVLLIMCDQWRHDAGGFAGSAVVRTPHLDELAAGGGVLSSAYCASPVCSPARASWLTGLLPHAHGQLANYGPKKVDAPGCRMRPEVITLGDLLHARGYRCGIVGPWHLGHDERPQHGFEEFWRTYRYQGGDGGDRLNQYFRGEGVENLYAGKAAGVTNIGVHLDYVTLTDPRQQRTTWTVDQCLEFLDTQENGRPFFLFASIKDPHPRMVVPPDLLKLYPPEAMKLPETWGDDLRGKPAFLHEEMGRIPPEVTEDQFRGVMAHYYALITHIDAQVGRLLDRLRERGFEDDTIVVFLSDHGEMLGEHGFTTKRLMYEGSVRVPLVVRWPGHIPPARIDTPVAGVDLFPTLAELTGSRHEHTVDGRSLAGALGAGREPEETPVLAEICSWRALNNGAYAAEDLAATAMNRHGRWKLIVHVGGERELYDLETDPLEMTNLAGDARHAAMAEALARELIEGLARTGPGVYAWCGLSGAAGPR